MIRFVSVLLGLLAVFQVPCPAPACSLCMGLIGQGQKSLRQEWEKAPLVLLGSMANPRSTNMIGGGVTDFHIERALKPHPALGNTRILLLNRYIPVLDPKKPPRFVLFCDIVKGKIEPFTGREVRSPALFHYLKGIDNLKGKDQVQALRYFFPYLDHEDATLANDAFFEFVRSNDSEVGQAARFLPPDKLRRLLQKPDLPAERISLFSFLLGVAGQEADARFLRAMIDRLGDRNGPALDGILGGYINLRPQEGWNLALKILADRRQPFHIRFAVVRTLRFYHGWKPQETRAIVLRGQEIMIGDGEIADMAIEDLRRWKSWDLTAKILAQFGQPSHNSPIVKRTIVRYALSCPLPDARTFVDRLRRQAPDLVREGEELLEFEKRK